ncbi:hypothetical protein [Bradyrhizobium iriomotense]|nr:hypothetical protein [Bradyrhizobium iriomotense]
MALAQGQEHENGRGNRYPERHDGEDDQPAVAVAESERQQDACDRYDD